MEGKLDAQFVVDIFQTGSGTSTNMNANEVIAGRANEIATGKRGGKEPVHPNDHVNMEQSSNDVIPTAMHVSAAVAIKRIADAGAGAFAAWRWRRRRRSLTEIVKIGRTHLQDATPVRLGQELCGIRGAGPELAVVRAAQGDQARCGTAAGRDGGGDGDQFASGFCAKRRLR